MFDENLLCMMAVTSNPNMPKEILEKLKPEVYDIDFNKPVPKEILEKLKPEVYDIDFINKPAPKGFMLLRFWGKKWSSFIKK